MTTGFLLATLTGIFYGLQGTYGKYLSHRYPSPVLAWAIFMFVVPFVLIPLIFNGIPTIHWFPFLAATFTSFLINVVAWVLFFNALQASPLYHTMPFTALTPLFIIPVAYVLMGELPDASGWLGIVLIISGAYGLHLGGPGLFAPFKNIMRERGTRLMILVAFIWSISATVEKIAVVNSSPEFYAATINSLLALAYWPYMMHRHRKYLTQLPQHLPQFALLGLISGIMVLCQFAALKLILVSYVIAFKRAGVVVSVLLGYVFFGEKQVIRHLICTVMMVVGAALIWM